MGTLPPPGRIQKPHFNSPQRHKQPPALRQPVVSRSGPPTAGTSRRNTAVRHHRHFNAPGLAIAAAQPDVLEDKARKMLNRVQNRFNLQLHRWSFGFIGLFVSPNGRINPRPVFFCPKRAILPRGSGDRALQEGNLSTEPSVDCGCIRPARASNRGRTCSVAMPSQAMVQSEKLTNPFGRQTAIFIPRLPTNCATHPAIF